MLEQIPNTPDEARAGPEIEAERAKYRNAFLEQIVEGQRNPDPE